jgi:hypothetical protein
MWFVDSRSASTPLPCGCDVAGPHVHLRSQLAKVKEPLKPSAVPATLPAVGSELSGTKREFGSTNSTVQPPQPREPPAHQHGPSCGHKRIRHGDHFDYIVPKPDGTAELHHPYTEPNTGEERYKHGHYPEFQCCCMYAYMSVRLIIASADVPLRYIVHGILRPESPTTSTPWPTETAEGDALPDEGEGDTSPVKSLEGMMRFEPLKYSQSS